MFLCKNFKRKSFFSTFQAYGWLNKFDDSKRFLLERPHLACEETANYLVRCPSIQQRNRKKVQDSGEGCIRQQLLMCRARIPVGAELFFSRFLLISFEKWSGVALLLTVLSYSQQKSLSLINLSLHVSLELGFLDLECFMEIANSLLSLSKIFFISLLIFISQAKLLCTAID